MRFFLSCATTLALLAFGSIPSRAEPIASPSREAASQQAIARDWMLQDYMSVSLPKHLEQEKQAWRDKYLTAPESKPDAPVLKNLACFTSRTDSLVERRMIQRVAEELGKQADAILADVESLSRAGPPGNDPRWKRLYLQACELRRVERLEPLLNRWKRFIFNQQRHVPDSWKYTEALSDSTRNRAFRPGSSLNLLEIDGPYGKVRTLLEDAGGILRNPDVSADGKRILFAWKKSDRQDDFHLYEMELADGRISQLTQGLGFADYEGIYLPDASILFSSTRCCQTVDCNWVVVSNLYLADGDGGRIRRVGFDQVHTIFPTLTDDGRVLYTRWEYSDRGQIFPQPLFQMNPDGTKQREFYGNNSWFPTNIIHARKIPGSRKVVAIVTGHHRPALGKLALIDPGEGRQEGRGVQLLAPVRRPDPLKIDRYGLGGNQFQYPYPLDEERFLVTLALPTPEGELGRFNVYLIDREGRRELLVEGQQPGEGIGCKQIVPLAQRNVPHVRPSLVDYRKKTGTFYLQDVYHGAALNGLPRGAIKRLRVIALEYRAAAIGSARQEGRGGTSEVTTPIAVASGSWDVKVVLGDATVHDDGSAFFEVPARRPVYFQALDENNRAVHVMRSWTTLMPGENQSCVGCHEHKNTTPRAEYGTSLAIKAGCQKLEPFYGPARGFSFAKEIQPILDRHCIECHKCEDDDAPNLSGELVDMGRMKRNFSRSYLSLTHTQEFNGDCNHPMVNWIDCMSEPELLPVYHRGAATSQLMTLLDEGHQDVDLSQEELDKIACWIDLLVPYCGTYTEAAAWSEEEKQFYARSLAKRKRMEDIERSGLQPEFVGRVSVRQ